MKLEVQSSAHNPAADGCANGRAACIFSVDVEDWFHILDLPSAPPLAHWDNVPSRVERNFERLLGLFDEAGVRVTCFFLGWVATRFPALVQRAERAGHEIASHGYAHRLVYRMSPEEFHEDAARSRKILEDVSGKRVGGYRAPGFSVTASTPWFFDKLCEAGYRYDSSIFPAHRNHGGWSGSRLSPYRVSSSAGELVEFPCTAANVLGRQLSVFGGGYLRLAPLALIRRMTRRVLQQDRPVIFYVHPREIDPQQPRLPMGMRRHFQSYVNLETTERKVRGLLASFPMISFAEFLNRNFEDSSAAKELRWQSPELPEARTAGIAR